MTVAVPSSRALRRTQVFLRNDQYDSLSHRANQLGRKSSELIRESIDLLLEKYASEKFDWKKNIKKYAGEFSDQRGDEFMRNYEEIKSTPSRRISSVFV